MDNSEQILRELAIKVNELKSLYTTTKVKLDSLTKENNELKEKLSVKEVKFNQLNEDFKMLKLAKSFAPNKEEKQSAKLKINQIVREIDKCITLLNK